jgi:pilus assembly protein CpaE
MEPIDGKIRIMIVDDVREGREGLARLLSFEPDMDVIGYASTGAEAIQQAKDLQPDVILMDINMPDMDGIQATELITKQVPVSVVMISVQSDRDYMRRAMQVGAIDFLPKPPAADELYATIRNAYERRPERSSMADKKDDKPKTGGTGKIIVVYSPQGGSGATTVAVNLASSLLNEHNRTLLIDANLQFGDVTVHLDISNSRNITDLAQAVDDLDSDLIENVLATHGTGLRVLPAPPRPTDAEMVGDQEILKIIEALAKRFDTIVIDTSLHLDDITVTLFDIADILVIVGIPTLPCVRNIRVVLDLLEHFEEFDRNKIVFAMNKVPVDKRSGAIDSERISAALSLPVRASIPTAEKQMLDSLNRGVPAIAVNTRQSPGKELQAFADEVRILLSGEAEVVLDEEGESQKRGWFG